MIEVSFWGWLSFLFVVCLSSLAGVAFSCCLPWSKAARSRGVATAMGLALAPFLAGFGGILGLQFLPGLSPGIHIATLVAWLILIGAVSARFGGFPPKIPWSPAAKAPVPDLLFGLLLAGWVAAVLATSVFFPLTQNDALEYATVGRILTATRTLASYPPLHPDLTASGFYGPWTHPPLYVALIYLANLLQGHADSPGLMRLISPWFSAVAVYLVYTLGKTINRQAAILSGLIFISTPLFFFGTDSALIDPLPILGLLALVTTILFLDTSVVYRGLVCGLVLGASLWTHSQALLFLPLGLTLVVFERRFASRRQLLLELSVLLLAAVLVGAWPYIHNYLLFGSPVSDNPAVFAIPSLEWPEYFQVERGLGSWPAVIQYGWLKGFFSLEAYGFSFWFMLSGLLCYFRRCRPSLFSRKKWQDLSGACHLVTACFLMVAFYHLGVICSTLIGTNLMIKNERYMLIILPFVSIIAGHGLSSLISGGLLRNGPLPGKAAPRPTPVLVALFALFFTVQLAGLFSYRAKNFGVTLVSLGQGFPEKLSHRNDYLAATYLREHTPQKALVLSLMPAIMYYSDRKMVSYLDPRLLPFYHDHDANHALEYLEGLGITYVLVPDYGIPPFYNSLLQNILRTPGLSVLRFSADGYQVYQLANTAAPSSSPLDISPAKRPWTRVSSLIIGGRKGFFNISTSHRPFTNAAPTSHGFSDGFFQRDWSTFLYPGDCVPPAKSLPACTIPVEGDQVYGLNLDFEGTGLLRIWIEQYNDFGPIRGANALSSFQYKIGELILTNNNPKNAFLKQIKALPGARNLNIVIECCGSAHVKILKATISPVHYDTTTSSP